MMMSSFIFALLCFVIAFKIRRKDIVGYNSGVIVIIVSGVTSLISSLITSMYGENDISFVLFCSALKSAEFSPIKQ